MPQTSQTQDALPSSTPPEMHSTNAISAMESILRGSALASPARSGWIRVSGRDRIRWLNGMVTQSIQDLSPGSGCYNFFLNAQGRIQGDAYAFREQESLLLQTDLSQVPSLMSMLDRYIIMDDVALEDASQRSGLLLLGPDVERVLSSAGVTIPDHDLALIQSTFRGEQIQVTRMRPRLVPRIEIWGSASSVHTLSDILRALGTQSVDDHAMEQLRLLEGTPRYSVDIRDRELPQETAQDQALHFAKGCYLGQEIVERIRSRGNVHRTLTGFRLEGDRPTLNRNLHQDGKVVGELTSFESIPLPAAAGGTASLALGYVRREALSAEGPLTYEGGTAVAISLPYAPAAEYASHFSEERPTHA